jgi:NAD(P)-dependent dehydrogenase (short-subunit alcohol dehydrogenase family)
MPSNQDRPVVIVTGASRGLGAAVSRLLVQEGANVILNGRSKDALQVVAAALAAGRVAAVAGDISQEAVAQQLVAVALDRFGRLDSLIHNAGIIEPIATLAEVEVAAWAYNLAVNVIAPVQLTQLALPHLRERRGRVISVSSGAAVSAIGGWAAYCSAKAALNQFNAVLAVEEPLVTAVAVRPGVVDTEMQTVIRRDGGKGMDAGTHGRFLSYHERGELLPPGKPGLAIARLALYAPPELSGKFINWDDPLVP